MKLNEVIVTVFLIGRISIAPGTLASLATAVFFCIFLQQYSVYLILVMTFSIYILALISISGYTKDLIHKDKSEIVIDEVIGQLIALIPIIWYKDNLDSTFLLICTSVILFRFFDIVKPQPIKYFDNINKAWAVIFDDCVAGFISAVVLILLINLLLI
jgi:phosphatidylglycerophosphatase A